MPMGPSNIELYEVTLFAGGTSGPEFYSHDGEKAGIVISGSFRLWLAEEPCALNTGDSFCFPSSIPHRFDNTSAESCTVYWIASGRKKPDSPTT